MKGEFFVSLFGHCFDASCANFSFCPINFLGLQIDTESSKGFYIRMTDFVSGLRSAFTDVT